VLLYAVVVSSFQSRHSSWVLFVGLFVFAVGVGEVLLRVIRGTCREEVPRNARVLCHSSGGFLIVIVIIIVICTCFDRV
jgi:hypothetical protein